MKSRFKAESKHVFLIAFLAGVLTLYLVLSGSFSLTKKNINLFYLKQKESVIKQLTIKLELEESSLSSSGTHDRNATDSAPSPPLTHNFPFKAPDVNSSFKATDVNSPFKAPDENWLQDLYSLVNKTPDENVFTIAYCYYRQEDRRFEPLGQPQFFSSFVGPYVSKTKTVIAYRPVVAMAKLLPTGVEPNSALGLTLLGLSPDVHLRVCAFGSTEITKVLMSVPGVVQGSVSVSELQQRLKSKNQWWENLAPGEVPPNDVRKWSHDAMIYWPGNANIHFPMTKEGKPFGPFIPRFNKEPWMESVFGVSTQFDTKRVGLSVDSVTVYYPMILDTMSWRLTANQYPNHWSSRVGVVKPGVLTIKQALSRPPGFVPNIADKPYFMTSINSHCAGPGAYLKSVAIRELFAFSVHALTNRSVHFLGGCPIHGKDKGGPKAPGVNELRKKSAVEAMAKHKFAIVFENSHTSGYFTEKVVNAYLAEAIPVYFGPFRAQIERILNVKAIIHCDLPDNLTSMHHLNQLTKQTCGELNLDQKSQSCHEQYSLALGLELLPHFKVCVQEIIAIDQDEERYLNMIREPLMKLDAEGEPTGIWSGKTYGQVISTLMTAFGYPT